ncbi:peptidoglycan-binding protein [Streptomyces sp. NPDC092046]|uniref:peptidoglycan-binding protein n=1 Tax=Streptomyces sp. NPDC092046 TaxID=3366009 RepID=UPI0038147CA6
MRSANQGTQDEAGLTPVEALRVELVRVKQDKGLSLDAFAHDTQYSRSSWNRVLKGEGFPPREAIERLCSRRKLDPARLLGLWEAADTARRTHPAPGTQPQPQPQPQPGDAESVAPDTSPTAGTDTGAGAGAGEEEQAADAGAPAHDALATSPMRPAEAGVTDRQTPAGRDDAAANPAQRVPPATVPVPHSSPATTSVPPAGSARPEHAAVSGHVPVPAPAGAFAAAPAAAVPPTASASVVGEDIGVVRSAPVPVPRAGRRRKVPTKVLVLAGLVVVLVLGRWAAWPDHKENAGAPPTAGDRPTDTQPPADPTRATAGGSQTPNDDKPDSVGRSTTPAPATGTPGQGGLATTTPPPTATPNPPGTTPSGTTPAPTTTPSTGPSSPPATASAALGAEGRAACAHYRPNRRVILAEGMVGTNVAQVQCLLNHNYDYTLTEDSKFGPATTAGVKAIQRCSGITVDGKVGPDTWKYLDYPLAGCGH